MLIKSRIIQPYSEFRENVINESTVLTKINRNNKKIIKYFIISKSYRII